jgi:hypothetical protein
VREYAFELRLCAHLEADGSVPGVGRAAGVVARQLGTSVHAAGGRIVDAVCVLPGPEFDDRVTLTSETVPPAVLDADVPVGEYERVTRVFDGPPGRARAVAERGADAGVLDVTRRDGQRVVRQVARYPDWVGGLVGVENKPDLGTPGDLQAQLRKDVSLGLFDRVVLATESYVTGAHLNRIPAEVGVWRVDLDDAAPVEVVREPTPLDPDAPGLQVVERHANRTEVRVADPAAKARQRRRIAERAYGKGWRPAAFPACERATAHDVAGTPLPRCAYVERVVEPRAECGPHCPGHDPAAPPAYAPEAERARRTAWRSDAGLAREQSGLDRFR